MHRIIEVPYLLGLDCNNSKASTVLLTHQPHWEILKRHPLKGEFICILQKTSRFYENPSHCLQKIHTDYILLGIVVDRLSCKSQVAQDRVVTHITLITHRDNWSGSSSLWGSDESWSIGFPRILIHIDSPNRQSLMLSISCHHDSWPFHEPI